MKLWPPIDQRGRLFEKINIIDFLTIVLLISLWPMIHYTKTILLLNRSRAEIPGAAVKFDAIEELNKQKRDLNSNWVVRYKQLEQKYQEEREKYYADIQLWKSQSAMWRRKYYIIVKKEKRVCKEFPRFCRKYLNYKGDEDAK